MALSFRAIDAPPADVPPADAAPADPPYLLSGNGATTEGATTEQALATLGEIGFFQLRGAKLVESAVQRQAWLLRSRGYFDSSAVRGGGLYSFCDPDALALPILDAFADPLIAELARRYFRCEAFLSPTMQTSSIRSIVPTAARTGGVPFHQDRAVIGVEHSLTFWFLLDPALAGEDAAGLDLATGEHKTLVRHAISAAKDRDTYYAMQPQNFVTPTIRRGDAIVFDNLCPHRTSVARAYTAERTSLDIRLWPHGTRLAGQMLRQGLGPVFQFRSARLEPRKLGEADGKRRFTFALAPVGDHAADGAGIESDWRDGKHLTALLRRARFAEDGSLEGSAATAIDFARFVDLFVARVELALEDKADFTLLAEATNVAGSAIERHQAGAGASLAGSIDPDWAMSLCDHARVRGARFFAAVLVDRQSGRCWVIAHDLAEGREDRIAGRLVADRFGNLVCVDR